MAVSAKMRVTKNQLHPGSGLEVVLQPVYSPDPESPNYSWSKYTPSGELKLFITNEACFDQFKDGAEYMILISPVD